MSNQQIALVGERLKSFREQQQLTQSELGRRAGIAAASVSHFETGQRIPSLESLLKLADALDVSVDDILGRTTSPAIQRLDPIFLRASGANARTLEIVRRVTAALLEAEAK